MKPWNKRTNFLNFHKVGYPTTSSKQIECFQNVWTIIGIWTLQHLKNEVSQQWSPWKCRNVVKTIFMKRYSACISTTGYRWSEIRRRKMLKKVSWPLTSIWVSVFLDICHRWYTSLNWQRHPSLHVIIWHMLVQFLRLLGCERSEVCTSVMKIYSDYNYRSPNSVDLQFHPCLLKFS